MNEPEKKKLLCLSPHMDDAVLSCFDHLRVWRNVYKVFILTLFSKYDKEGEKLETAKKYLRLSGFDEVSSFQSQREKEDDEAMKLVEVEYGRVGLVDAAFRHGRNENEVLQQLIKALRGYQKYDKVLVPLGIGKHKDHILTRQAARLVFKNKPLMSYVDYPYALCAPWVTFWQHTWFRRISRSSFSWDKRRAVLCYTSQIEQLSLNELNYEEIVVE